MSTTVIHNEETKQTPYIVKLDVKRLDDINVKAYGSAELEFSERFFQMACSAYSRSSVYRNYRKKFIAVKINRPSKADLVAMDVIKLDSFCDANKIQIVKTGTGIVYRIPKK